MKIKKISFIVLCLFATNSAIANEKVDISKINDLINQISASTSKDNQVKNEKKETVADNKEDQSVLDTLLVGEKTNETSTIKEKETLIETKQNIKNETTVESLKTEIVASNDEYKKENIFLYNIPLETKIYANTDIMIFPNRDMLIYYDGALVTESPLLTSELSTFCYIDVLKQGGFRRIPSFDEKNQNKKGLKIVGSESKSANYSSLNGNGTLLKRTHTFLFDNQHIKSLTCVTTEPNKELKTSDIIKATGDLFRFEFPSIIDVL